MFIDNRRPRGGQVAAALRAPTSPPLPQRIAEDSTPLLAGLAEIASHIELVTTNYDVVLETALDVLSEKADPPIDSGWRGTIYRRFDTGLWSTKPSTHSKGLLTKLHGSVNWTRDGDEILVATPFSRELTNDMQSSIQVLKVAPLENLLFLCIGTLVIA